MQYVSAEWVDTITGKVIKATGDDGKEYWLSDVNSDVPPWPEFLAEKGVAAITGKPPPQEKTT